ncbi:hypothetical protein DFH06DRAFT_1131829 [Mycena polygramma]|nr:hypothetical protein DFH06DRAFT_1131829 [Mycena polygramma]
MPRLKQFHLTNIESGATIASSGAVFLERLVQRSPLISDLRLSISAISLLHILHLLPCLTKLRLLLVPFNSFYDPPELDAPKFFAAITPRESAPSACAALQELITESDWFEDNIWVDFLQAHLDYGTNLRRLEVHFLYAPSDIIVPDVTPFFDRGLGVCLRYPAKDQYTPWEGIKQFSPTDD